jgi:hypothetical protein
MKLYLDDVRIPTSDWKWVKTAKEAIRELKTGLVTHVSLDHDLGDDSKGTGYDVVNWIEKAVVMSSFIPPKITIHTSNPAARKKMEAGVRSIERLYKELQNV